MRASGASEKIAIEIAGQRELAQRAPERLEIAGRAALSIR